MQPSSALVTGGRTPRRESPPGRITIRFRNERGLPFGLRQLLLALDGASIYSSNGPKLDQLGRTTTAELKAGSVVPGNHTVSLSVVVQGRPVGPLFNYLAQYKYMIRTSKTFAVRPERETVLTITLQDRGPLVRYGLRLGVSIDEHTRPQGRDRRRPVVSIHHRTPPPPGPMAPARKRPATSPLRSVIARQIPQTAANKRILAFCERYHRALQQMDVGAILSLASSRHSAMVKMAVVDRAGLKRFLERRFRQIGAYRLRIRYQRIYEKDGLVQVEYVYSATIQPTGVSGWITLNEESALVLERVDGGFRIVSGI